MMISISWRSSSTFLLYSSPPSTILSISHLFAANFSETESAIPIFFNTYSIKRMMLISFLLKLMSISASEFSLVTVIFINPSF